MPLTHDEVVSLRLSGNKLVVTTWSEHSDPWMLSLEGSLRPNTYEFNGPVVLRSVEVIPESTISAAELKRRLELGEAVTLTVEGKRPHVEIDYEYIGGKFYLDVRVRWY